MIVNRLCHAAGRAAPLLAAAFLATAAGDHAAAQDGADGISYADVLAAPDDLDVNFRYARQQIEAGRLDRAGTVLERLLIARPDWNEVRLLYGVVLYRLGQHAEAELELAAVNAEALTREDRATLARFRALAAREQARISGSVGLTAGLHYDTNRNNFPLDGAFQIDLPDLGPTLVEGREGENADLGRYALVDGTVVRDTGLQRLSEVSVDAAALVDDQVEEDQLDALSGLIGVGALYGADFADIRPRVLVRHINLGDEPYLTSGEARLRAERRIGTDARLLAHVEATGGYEDFSGVDADPFAFESSGAFYALEVGARYVPVDRLRLSAQYRFTGKEAEQDYEAFLAHGIRVEAEYVVTPGLSVTGFGAYTRQDFDSPDPFVSRTTEQGDNEIAAGLGAFVSIDTVLQAAGIEAPDAATRDLVLGLTGSFRQVESNIDNFDYRNFRLGVSLTKRFNF